MSDRQDDRNDFAAAMDHIERKHGDALRALAPYDHTFQVTAWRDGPWWFLEIEAPQWALTKIDGGYWGTQTPWLRLAEYMAKDFLVCQLDLDYKYWDQISVNITRAIGPIEDSKGYYRPSSWAWATRAGVVDTWRKWRLEREVRSGSI